MNYLDSKFENIIFNIFENNYDLNIDNQLSNFIEIFNKEDFLNIYIKKFINYDILLNILLNKKGYIKYSYFNVNLLNVIYYKLFNLLYNINKHEYFINELININININIKNNDNNILLNILNKYEKQIKNNFFNKEYNKCQFIDIIYICCNNNYDILNNYNYNKNDLIKLLNKSYIYYEYEYIYYYYFNEKDKNFYKNTKNKIEVILNFFDLRLQWVKLVVLLKN